MSHWGSQESPSPCHGEEHGFKSRMRRQMALWYSGLLHLPVQQKRGVQFSLGSPFKRVKRMFNFSKSKSDEVNVSNILVELIVQKILLLPPEQNIKHIDDYNVVFKLKNNKKMIINTEIDRFLNSLIILVLEDGEKDVYLDLSEIEITKIYNVLDQHNKKHEEWLKLDKKHKQNLKIIDIIEDMI